MLSPDYILHISEGAEQIAEQLHIDIINRIVERMMIRIGRGDDYLLTAVDKWQIEVLQDAGYLLEDIQREIAKRTRQQEPEIRDAMIDAGVRAIEYDNAIYEAAGLSPLPLMQSPYLMRIMERNYRATLGEWKNFTQTGGRFPNLADAAQNAFKDACDKAYHLTVSGAVSYTHAVREAVNDIVKDGVKVKYPSGREDTIETATLRAVRTGISQATAQITIARMKEMGVSLALTSSHLGARPTHEVWQGQIFSIDWKKMNEVYPLPEIPTPPPDVKMMAKYPDFVDSTRIGKVDGLSGANCRHSFSVYFEGMSNPFEHYDSEENKKQYEIQQKQRYIERTIRKTKREVMGMKTAVDNAQDEKLKFELDLKYQDAAAYLQKWNKKYNDFCAENNLKRLSDRLEVARFDRAQAAAARGAARRYENARK